MLSRVAERIYWAARYLERVENTSRLVRNYTLLLLDLPQNVDLSWYNLIILNNAEKEFSDRYQHRSEKNIIKFLLANKDNASAMIQCLKMVRENVRTTRDVMPPETWETVNELSLFMEENIQQGINRTNRHEFLDTVAQDCHKVHGLIEGAMRRDEAWQFFQLGSNIERADMTSRILESGATMLLHQSKASDTKLSHLVWGSILHSLSAHHSYQRTVRTSVNGPGAVRFMLEDPHFPRTVSFCVNALLECAINLPRNETAVKHLNKLKRSALKEIPHDNLGQPFVDWLGHLQLEIANLHLVFSDNWFYWE